MKVRELDELDTSWIAAYEEMNRAVYLSFSL